MRASLLLLAMSACAVAQTQPSIVSILPADGSKGVPLNATVIINYGFLPANSTPVRLTKAGIVVSGTTELAFPNVRFTPDKPLDANTTYKVEFISNSTLPVGSFTTGTQTDTTSPTFVSSTPPSGADGFSTTGTLKLVFSKPLNALSLAKAPFTLRDLTGGYVQTTNSGYAALSGPQLQPDGLTMLFNPSFQENLQLGHAYQLEFAPSGLADWLGNPLKQVPAPIVFTTFRNPSATGPLLTGSVPANGDPASPTNSSIVLVFDRPLAQLTYDSYISLDAGGPVNFTVDNSLAGGRVLIIQPAVLLPPLTQVTLRITGLVDEFGRSLPTPLVLQFRTGVTPETRQLKLTSSVPPVLSQNAILRATFNRPLDPVLVALGAVTISPANIPNGTNASPYQISDDHLTLTFAPVSPLPAGSYQAAIFLPFDRYFGKQSQFNYPTLNFTIRGDTDSTAPLVSAITPPDGTLDAPPSSVIQVAFSKAVAPLTASTVPFQLTESGSPVPGTFTINGAIGTFVPKNGLDPSNSYQIQIAGLTDLYGNPLAPFTSSFGTASANPTGDPFKLISSSPAFNATAADPTAPIVLTFNRPVNPVSAFGPNAFTLYQTFPAPVTGTFQTNGSTLTFMPRFPLQGGKYFLYAPGITDLSGNPTSSVNGGFQMANPSADPTPLTVTSVSPGDGQAVNYQQPYVVFTFSKPIDPATVTSANFVALTAKGNVAVQPALLAGGNQVSLSFSAGPSSLVTLYVNPGVTDFAGNTVVPFRTTVRTTDIIPVANPQGAYVISQRPSYTSPKSAPNASISLAFNMPLDRASVEQGLLVAVKGSLVTGTVVWTPDSTGFTFVPDVLFPYSAFVDLAIVSPAQDALGNPFNYSLGATAVHMQIVDVPPAPAPALSVLRSNLPVLNNAFPLDGVIELEFDRDVPGSAVLPSAATLVPVIQFNNVFGPPIPCTITSIGQRILRFTPTQILAPNGSYQFSYDPGLGQKYSGYFLTGTSKSPAELSTIAAGPLGSNVPINARISVAFSNPASEFSMPNALVLRSGGNVVPTNYLWSASDRAVTLTPYAWLAPDTDYTVTLSGMEDLAGHTVADRTWTFHTSSQFDFQLASVLRVAPSGAAASPNATVSITFSEPVTGDWIDRFTVGDLGYNASPYVTSPSTPISGSIRFSDDQRNVFFTPDHPFPANHSIAVVVPVVDDFAGNVDPMRAWYDTTTYKFRVGLAPSGAPVVTASNPDDGSTGLPLNVKLQVLFNQSVMESSLDGVTLLQNGSAVPATVKLEADGRTLTTVPVSLPSAGTTYSLLVAGVRNTDGAAMTSSFQMVFTTGAMVDETGPLYRSLPVAGQLEVPLNAPLRIRFNEPLNKLTAIADNVFLTRGGNGPVVDTTMNIQDNGKTIVLVPTIALAPDTQYNLSLVGVTDLAGNPLSSTGPQGLSFSTSSGLPAVPATLIAFDPPDGSQNIPPTFVPLAVFNQPLDLTLGDGTIQLSGPNGIVPGALSTIGGTIKFTPTHPLADGLYQMMIGGLADVGGNPVPPVSSTFTVSAAGVDNTQLKLVSSDPPQGAAGVPVTSTITLNFSKPVSAVSAAQLPIRWSGGAIPGSFQTQGATVIFTPSTPMPGAATIGTSNFSNLQIQDLRSIPTYFSYQFTTGPNPDTTPPTLLFSAPQDGALIPPGPVNVAFRFSKPVASSSGTSAIQVFAGGNNLTSNFQFLTGEDGQTFTGSFNFSADTDITVAITSDLKDFSGNSIQPITLHLRTASLQSLQGPSVLSISPALGAVNVDPKTPIELRFSQSMVAGSVQAGLRVATNAGISTGTVSNDDASQTFDYHSDLPWPNGSGVDMVLDPIAYDLSGARITAQYSHFTVLSVFSNTAPAISFSASPTAIDIRFAGPVPEQVLELSYLHLGGTLVASRSERAARDQIRIVPESPLQPGVTYHLVLDADHEIAIRIPESTGDIPRVTSIDSDAATTRIHFSGPINPITLYRGGLKLLRSDGTSVAFTTEVSQDLQEVVLVPVEQAAPLTPVLDGVEARSGILMRRTY